MTSYRQSMNQTLNLMYLMREVKILERELTDKDLSVEKRLFKVYLMMSSKTVMVKIGCRVKRSFTVTKMAKAEELEMDDDDEEDDEDEREKTKEAGVSLAKRRHLLFLPVF